ncbi:MAG: hypothetical protein ABI193_26665 [Minicystis sp.]
MPKKPIKSSPKQPAAQSEGSAEDFAKFLPFAQEIPAGDVLPFRADAALAYHNIVTGLDAVLAHESTLTALPAPFQLSTLKSLPRCALALMYAFAQVDRSSPGTASKLLKRAAELRDLLLSSAVALSKAGLLPEKEVRRIQQGKGKRDQAQDCVDLAALFRAHASALKGKSAISKAQIDESAQVGDELLKLLKPRHAKAKVAPAVKSAVDARDRLWTLVVTRHREQLRRAGMWIFVDDVDEHVPPLQSRVVRRGKKPKASGSGGGGEGDKGGGSGSGGG